MDSLEIAVFLSVALSDVDFAGKRFLGLSQERIQV